MRIIIDCNVFVSAALGGKTCQQVFEKSIKKHSIFYSDKIVTEIKNTFLKPKLQHAEKEGYVFLKQVQKSGTKIYPQCYKLKLPDPKDDMYLHAAIHVEADAIITGNTKHFPKKICRGIRVLTPREFIEL